MLCDVLGFSWIAFEFIGLSWIVTVALSLLVVACIYVLDFLAGCASSAHWPSVSSTSDLRTDHNPVVAGPDPRLQTQDLTVALRRFPCRNLG